MPGLNRILEELARKGWTKAPRGKVPRRRPFPAGPVDRQIPADFDPLNNPRRRPMDIRKPFQEVPMMTGAQLREFGRQGTRMGAKNDPFGLKRFHEYGDQFRLYPKRKFIPKNVDQFKNEPGVPGPAFQIPGVTARKPGIRQQEFERKMGDLMQVPMKKKPDMTIPWLLGGATLASAAVPAERLYEELKRRGWIK